MYKPISEKMNLTKENVCVFIGNRKQLDKARRILEDNSEVPCRLTFTLPAKGNIWMSFCYYNGSTKDWEIYERPSGSTEITLEELEKLLKQ